MTDWTPLDEKELLRETSGEAYYDNTSPQDHQAASRTVGGGFGDASSPTGGATQVADVPPPPRASGKEITREMIMKALEKQGTRRRPHATADDPYAEEKWLASQSHLHLNGCHIGRITNLRSLQTLEVLYLYDNQISLIENVAPLRRLTHLYLTNNNIREISGLAGLPNLQKLYIEKNCLTTVSGLEQCPSLEELHVSQQRLPPGTPLAFAPACMAALSVSLRVLTAGQCNISSASVGQLRGLSRLRRLDLSHNGLDAFEALDPVVQPCGLLGSLDLRGNPICKQSKYRDTIILMNDSVTTLDDEPVQAQHREFLLRLHIRRMKAQLAAELKEEEKAAAAAAAAAAGGVDQDGPGAGASGPTPSGGSVGGGTAPSGGSFGAGPIPPASAGPAAAVHGHGHGHGVAGAAHRVPPRTGGFAAPPGGGPGAGGSGGAARSLSRNTSTSGRVAVQAVTLGMDGLGLSR
ncbi:hypothetical protein HYH02_012075 [Chlamydomonas schloesseri]|uniref:Uncharacterized protein n=1 Tax=Chlamydomonas schloesseri TaxID=2026947 RepID=A0A835W0M1_9CHLO|nr:hypothetical protein HYH02_012075 [Chlamydomonas schloesseri]|eukprot:KAG2434875.1 hypothetical protein HYH02_012075 [Chlamydomonas schloesseri]